MRFLLLSFILALVPTVAAAAPPRGRDIHFIDTEGGAATLIVTPAGEAVLIDCGNPGTRDPERIHIPEMKGAAALIQAYKDASGGKATFQPEA